MMLDNKTAQKLSFKQKFGLFFLALVCVFLTVLIFAPAAWFGLLLQAETGGRLALGDVEGSLWEGSGFLGVAVDEKNALTPIVPGRFKWEVSPILLLGQIELEIKNPETLQQPLYITGNLRHVQVSPGNLLLPTSRLAGLGAPLNTVKPTGNMVLSWNALGLTFLDGDIEVDGTMKLTMEDIASALSPVKPLGSYVMNFEWRGRESDVDLETTKGPLLLSGKGSLVRGRLQFSGQAQPQAGQEESLANLLSLLGQRRPGAGKHVIALEFK